MHQPEPRLLQKLRESWGEPGNVMQVITEMKEVDDPRVARVVLALVDDRCLQWFVKGEGIPSDAFGILTTALQAIAQWRRNGWLDERLVSDHYQDWAACMGHFMHRLSSHEMSVEERWRYQAVYELKERARLAVKGDEPQRLTQTHYRRFFPWVFDQE